MTWHFSSRFVLLFPEGTRAVTLGEHVFLRGPSVEVPILLHETAHVRQFRIFGWVGFFARYFWSSITRGYSANPFEVEAREFAAANRREAWDHVLRVLECDP